jgi:uncharacterized coiled-coil DUF342 family protein
MSATYRRVFTFFKKFKKNEKLGCDDLRFLSFENG